MRRLLLLLALLVLGPSLGAVGDEAVPEAPRGPPWFWRPGHAELYRWTWRDGAEVLEGLDPATGKRPILAPLGRLREAVDREEMPAEGIGRAAVPVFLWSPDGTALVVVSKGDLVWYELEGGFTRVLTNTASPLSDVRIAPDARHVAFARDHDLWVVPTREGKPRRLTSGGSEAMRNATLDWLYPEELHFETAIWFSPDGARIAYLQMDERAVPTVAIPLGDGTTREQRYPKPGEANPRVRVGVVPVAGGETTWLDLGAPEPEYVARVAWAPSGEHVAVAVLDRAQQTLRLLACPVDGGPPVEVLRDHDDAWVDVPPPPTFVDGTHFLWRNVLPNGRVGWWRMEWRTDGGETTGELLTSPHEDVWPQPFYDVAGERAHGLADTLEGIRRRPRAGGGGEEPPYAPPAEFDTEIAIDDTGTYARVTWSRADVPPITEVRRVADGAAVRRLPSAWRAEKAPRFEFGRLPPGEDGRTGVHWRLWHPEGGDAADGPSPLVLLVYGGPGSRRIVDRWDAGRLAEVGRYLERGWFVLEVDGRGATGFGRDAERAVYRRLGLVQIDDQVRAVRHLVERPSLDAERVAIVGWSFGGTMACLGLTRHPGVFRAGVAIAPVTDWRLYDTIYTERYLGTPQERPEAYAATDVISRAGELSAPLLLLHGEADDNVHVENVTRLAKAAKEAGIDTLDLRVYPGVGHGLGRFHRAASNATSRFLEAHLGPPRR